MPQSAEEARRDIYGQIWKSADAVAAGAEQMDRGKVEVYSMLLREQVNALDAIERRIVRENSGADHH